MSFENWEQKIVSDNSSYANDICYYSEGLRILAIDDNRACLEILSHILKKCGYQVTTMTGAVEAYETLKNNKDGYDLVLTEVTNNMDCFKFAELVTVELGIPVIFVSEDDRKETIMNSFKHGAQCYLLKPVRDNELKLIWQHVVPKKHLQLRKLSPDRTTQDSISSRLMESNNDQEGKKQAKEKKKALPKKQRFSWNQEKMTKFVNAIEFLGIDNAVPKKILEIMNDPTVTRENVASRLQKYREKEKTKNMLQEYEHATKSNTLRCSRNLDITDLSSVQPTYTNSFGTDTSQASMPPYTFQFRPPMWASISNIAASSHQNQHFGPTQDMNGMRFNYVYPRPMKTENNYSGAYSCFPGGYDHSRAPISMPRPFNSMLIRQPSSFGPIQTQSTQISQPTNSFPMVPPSFSNGPIQTQSTQISQPTNSFPMVPPSFSNGHFQSGDSLDFSFDKLEPIMNNPNWDPLYLDQTLPNSEIECDFAFNSSEADITAIFNNNSDPSLCS